MDGWRQGCVDLCASASNCEDLVGYSAECSYAASDVPWDNGGAGKSVVV